MRFPTMWYVQPAKAQTSLRICAVWSEPLLVSWIFYDCSATCWTAVGVSELNRRLCMLVWVCSCQIATLLEITCRSSNTIYFWSQLSIIKSRERSIICAITCYWSSLPFSEEIIEISAYSDIWGVYSDNLICWVSSYIPTRCSLPIQWRNHRDLCL